MTPELLKKIHVIPSDIRNAKVEDIDDVGWWRGHAEQRFIKRGEQLLKLGLNEAEVYEFLEDIYYSVSAEFGS